MKKTIVLVVFLLLNMISYGQNVGFRIGKNLSKYSFNKDSLTALGITNDNLSGWALNVPVEFHLNKNLAIQTELGFLQKGFKSVQNTTIGGIAIKSELKNYTNYAVLPVMVRFHTAGRFLQAYANVGTDASYAINATSKGTTTVGNTSSVVSNDVNIDGTDRLKIGLLGGGGLKLKLGAIAVVLDTRFLTDLKDSNGNFNVKGLTDKAFTTNGWVTSLGVVFGR